MRRIAPFVLGMLVLGGCKATILDNHFSCDVDDDCPPEQTCMSGLCSSGAARADAGPPRDGAVARDSGSQLDGGVREDGGAPDGGARDAGASDAGVLDGGPGPLSGTEVAFPLGSLIIPMDTTYQSTGLLRAFGLVYRLLKNDIPVSWVVRPGKASGEADFTVSARNTVTSATISSYGYRGGPFVIHASDVVAAMPFVTAWLGVYPETTVHAATEDFDGFVAAQLVAAPNLALFDDGNSSIVQPYLQGASISDSVGSVAWDATSPDFLTPVEVAGPTTTSHRDGDLFDGDGDPVYCFMASMHWGETDAVTPEGLEVVSEYRDWLQHPVHLFAECAAAIAIENSPPGRFLTPSGFESGVRIDLPPYEFRFADLPFAQMDGPFEVTGGSYPTFSLPAGDDYLDPGVVAISLDAAGRGTADAWITGFIDGDCSIGSEPCLPPNPAGKVSYLGGHAYRPSLPLSVDNEAQGARLFLNALLDSPCAADVYQPRVAAVVEGPGTTTDATTTFTVRYANEGYGTALAARLVFRLPANATDVSASSGGSWDGETVTWDLDNLGHEERGAVTVTAQLAGPGVHRGSATLSFRSGATARTVASNTQRVCYQRPGDSGCASRRDQVLGLSLPW